MSVVYGSARRTSVLKSFRLAIEQQQANKYPVKPTRPRWDKNQAHRARFDLSSTVVYALLHLGCFGVFYTGLNLEAIAVLSTAFVMRSIGVSLVYHRYFAHRSFRTSRLMQFFLGMYGAFTVLGGPLWWASTHRKHHRHADTPDDLHSPYYCGFIYSHCGWFLDNKNRDLDISNVRDLARFPELIWLERWDGLFKLGYMLCYYWWFGLVGVVWGFFVPTVIVLQMIHWIQSVSHSIGGYRRYPTPDDSRNHWLFGVLSLGEGYHHNHHAFPSSACMGLRWWEFDAGYYILIFLYSLGLIWDLKTPKEKMRAGYHPLAERHVALVRADVRKMAEQLDNTLTLFELESEKHEELRSSYSELRRKVALKVGLLDERLRDLIVAGPSVLRRALETLRLVLHEDARAIVGTAAGIEQLSATIERIDATMSDVTKP